MEYEIEEPDPIIVISLDEGDPLGEQELEKTVVIYVPQELFYNFAVIFPMIDNNSVVIDKPVVKDNYIIKQLIKCVPDETLYIEIKIIDPDMPDVFNQFLLLPYPLINDTGEYLYVVKREEVGHFAYVQLLTCKAPPKEGS